MEVVLLLVAITGIALIAVPRVQARRAGAGARRRVASRPRPHVARAVAAAPAAWSPPTGEDEWEDDLGWEGADAPPARDEWNRWRSSRDGAAESEPERDELPSVQRWRERAPSGDDWLEDDDGLGWEGDAPSAGDIAAARNGNPGEAAARELLSRRNAGGDPDTEHELASPANGAAEPDALASRAYAAPANGAAAPHGLASPGNGVTEPDALASRAYAAPANGAGASAGLASPGNAAASPRDLASPGKDASAVADPAARAGGGSRGFDWLRPGARDSAPAAPRRAIHPVLLVALYAAAGIGAVVLASTVLLGGGSAKPTKPAAQPRATAAAATPAPQPTVDASAQQARQAAAVKAAKRKEIAAFRKQRAAARHAEAAAIAKARAKARADAKKRAEDRGRGSAAPPSGGSGSSAPPATPASGGSAGGSNGGGGGGGGGRTCEFCIG